MDNQSSGTNPSEPQGASPAQVPGVQAPQPVSPIIQTPAPAPTPPPVPASPPPPPTPEAQPSVQQPAPSLPPQPVTQPPLEQHNSFFSSHFKLISIVLFIVILGGGGGYLMLANQQTAPAEQTVVPTPLPSPTPTPNPTATWLTYTNTEQEYSIKYPPEWVPKPSKTDESVITFATQAAALGTTDQTGPVSITVQKTIKTPLIQEAARQKIITQNVAYLGGLQGERVELQETVQEETPASTIQSAVVFNNRAYYFTLKDTVYTQWYDLMLSTVTFGTQSANPLVNDQMSASPGALSL